MMSVRYRVSLQHSDQPDETGGLARGRVVGMATATFFDTHDEAAQALNDWLTGGDGDRASRWTGSVVSLEGGAPPP